MFEAAAGTLNKEDVIADGSTTDNDTLNVVLNSSQITASATTLTPTISGIENINVELDSFTGTATSFNATSVSGSTITLSSKKAGFDGKAGVLAAAGNNVTAGAGVQELTVAGLTTGVINAGTAKKAVDIKIDEGKVSSANLTVNGDVKSLTVKATTTAAGLKAVNITATEASVLTSNDSTGAAQAVYGAAATTTFNLTGDITLKGKGATALTGIIAKNAGTGTIKAEITDTTAADLSKAQISEVILADAYAGALTLQEGVKVTAKGALADNANFINGAEFAAQKQGSALSIDLGGASIGATTVTGFQNTTINIKQDLTAGEITKVSGDVTGEMGVAFVGKGNVTAAATTMNSLDASGITGGLIYVAADTNKTTIKGGAGANSITTGATGEISYVGQAGGDKIVAGTIGGTLAVETGAGKDTLEINAFTGGKILANLGAGDDSVKIKGTTVTGLISIDGGAGNDVLTLDNSTAVIDLSGAQAGSKIEGFETLKLYTGDTANPTNKLFTLGAFALDGANMKIVSDLGKTTGSPATDNYEILVKELDAASQGVTLDMSGLTFDMTKPFAKLNVETAGGNDVITVANLDVNMTSLVNTGAGNDTIIVGGGMGKTSILVEGGNNSIDLSQATSAQNAIHFHTTATGTTSITGWNNMTKLSFEGMDQDAKFESFASTAQVLATDTAYFVNTKGEAGAFTMNGTAAITDFNSKAQVAAYLGEHFNGTDYETGPVKTTFVLNNENDSHSYIYTFDGSKGDVANDIEVAELTLIGVIDYGANMVMSSSFDNSVTTTDDFTI